jgi:hypothetical protein
MALLARTHCVRRARTAPSLDPAAAVLSVLTLLALLQFKLGLPKTLAASALLGAAWKLL